MRKVVTRKFRPPRKPRGAQHEDLDDVLLEDWMCAGAPPS